MAKRPEQQSLLSIALADNWMVPATLAIGLAVITFFVVPVVANPLFKLVTLFSGIALSIFLGLIAIFIFFGRKTSNRPSNEFQHDIDSDPAFWPDVSSAPAETSNADLGAPLSGNQESRLQERPSDWSLQLIQDIEWKRFEELSIAYYLEKGIRAEATSLGADGGIDIKLYPEASTNPDAIVQCKEWNSRQVGVKQIHEFLDVMALENVAKGFYMTAGEYSDDAREIAKATKIHLINAEMLLMMIKRLPEESQKGLLALATEGDYTTPTCPSCDVKMVRRSGKRGDFWGCQNYPQCHQMLHPGSCLNKL